MKTIADIRAAFPHYNVVGDSVTRISTALPAHELHSEPNPQALSWVSDSRAEMMPPQQFTAGLLICSPQAFGKLKNHRTAFLLASNPRLAFAQVMHFLFAKEVVPGIAASAVIHPSVQVGTGCHIGHGVVIEENCIIGNHVVVLHHTVIHAGTVIGDHSQIGTHNTIGGSGFGYEKDEKSRFVPLTHIGRVEIGHHTIIHNHCCIDRAVMGATRIGNYVRIDNHVHVAHGVQVGEGSLLIAHAMIGGSATIGRHCWIAPSACIKNQIHVGDDAVVGMGAVVIRDVAPGTVVAGNPAKVLSTGS